MTIVLDLNQVLQHDDAFEGDRKKIMSGHNTRALIVEECDSIKSLLLEKNEAYGNSASDPIRVFSRADPEEQLLVRIDDKLSRIMRGKDSGEDVLRDLVGYIVLLRVTRKLKQRGLKP
jgi:hypothetical protein